MLIINPKITINAVDLTGYISSIDIDEGWADVDTTTFGNNSKRRVAGLGDHKLSLEFQQNFGVALVDQTITPLLGSTTTVTAIAQNAATSTVNPLFSVVAVVEDWKPISGKVGELLQSSVTWPIDGAVTRLTS